MEAFLASCSAQSRNWSQFDVVHVVLGNEACDLDSIVCSLAYGLFLNVRSDMQGTTTGVLPQNKSSRTAVIPVLNIPKDDFKLRTEAVYLLKRAGVDCSQLTFIDNVDLLEIQRRDKLQITLVDHNMLAQHQKQLAEAVVEIIDHHKDDWAGRTPIKKTIELVGSCATLIAERILNVAPTSLDTQVTMLLLATISLDCINLDPRAGRATEKDRAVLDRLQKHGSCGESRDELYKSVSQAKYDVSSLSTMDLLRKDYKALYSSGSNPVGIAICSVGGMELDDLFSKESSSRDSERFCKTRNIDVLILMTIFFPSFDDPPKRQVAVCGRHPMAARTAEFLFHSEELQLRKIDPLCSESCIAFDQENIKASRKVLLPLVNAFLNGNCD